MCCCIINTFNICDIIYKASDCICINFNECFGFSDSSTKNCIKKSCDGCSDCFKCFVTSIGILCCNIPCKIFNCCCGTNDNIECYYLKESCCLYSRRLCKICGVKNDYENEYTINYWKKYNYKQNFNLYYDNNCKKLDNCVNFITNSCVNICSNISTSIFMFNYCLCCFFPHILCRCCALNCCNHNLSNYPYEYNYLDAILTFVENPYVTKLAIEGTDCSSSLPSTTFKLPNLQVINAMASTIEQIPSQIELCVKLETLILSNSNISSIHSNIGMLNNLEGLYLSNNYLTYLPESIGNLKKLVHLYLNHNQLIILPESIAKLNKLNFLDVSNNKLVKMPENLDGLENLKSLKFDFNEVSLFPVKLTNLKDLNNLRFESNCLELDKRAVSNLIMKCYSENTTSYPFITCFKPSKLKTVKQMLLIKILHAKKLHIK